MTFESFLEHLDKALQRNAAITLAQLQAGVSSGIMTNSVSISVVDAILTAQAEPETQADDGDVDEPTPEAPRRGRKRKQPDAA